MLTILNLLLNLLFHVNFFVGLNTFCNLIVLYFCIRFLVPNTNSFSGGLNRRSTPPTEYQTMQSNHFDGNQAEGNC